MTATKSFLLCIFLLVAPAPASAFEYDRYKSFELAACADLVVTGTIRSIETGFLSSRPSTFVLDVEQLVAGDKPPERIEVGCFKNWTCAARWTPYKEGQRVILFLAKPTVWSTVHHILGGGGEGEMPLLEGSVCVRGYTVLGYESETYTVDTARVAGALVPVDEFVQAIRGLRATYLYSVGEPREQIASIQPKEDLAKAELYAATSKTARHFHEEALSSGTWAGALRTGETHTMPSDAERIEAEANGLGGPARFAPGAKPNGFGSGLFTSFGRDAAFIGDVDGNGKIDLAAGAPNDCYSGHFHGALWIVLRGADQGRDRFVEISERQGGFPARLSDFGHLGEGVAPVGDLDGDLVPDVAVGAPSWDGPEKHRGGVWLLFLTRDGTASRAAELGSDPKVVEAGARGPVGIGHSLANLGDLDGDGYPELAIGQDPVFNLGVKQGRAVLITSLGKGGQVRWATRIDPKLDGFSSDYAWFGETLAGVGDVDGDGVRDLAIASTNDDDGGEVRGAVWIVFLKPDGGIKGKQKISDWQGNFSGLLHDWSCFGRALGAPGDVDGDKVPDLLVSSQEGIWTLFLTADGTVRSHVLNLAPGEAADGQARMGTSLAVAPYRTSDGSIALAVGARVGTKSATDSCLWFLGLTSSGVLTRQ